MVNGDENNSLDKSKLKVNFSLPENYFTDFSKKINSRIPSIDTLSQLSFLNEICQQSQDEANITLENSDLLDKLRIRENFKIPYPDYFEESKNKLENSIRVLTELEGCPFLITNFSTKKPFLVPLSYFENFPLALSKRKHIHTNFRFGSIFSFFSKKWNMAYSLFFVFLISGLTYAYFNHFISNKAITDDCIELTCISQEEVVLKLQEMDLSTDEIEELVESEQTIFYKDLEEDAIEEVDFESDDLDNLEEG